MERIGFDYSGVMNFLSAEDIDMLVSEAAEAKKTLDGGTGAGSDYLGWLDLPSRLPAGEIDEMVSAAEEIRANSEVFVVIGIGGSYLGSRAAITALNSEFHNEPVLMKQKGAPAVYFAGCNMSGDYLRALLSAIEGKKATVNVVSKSGTTTEPAIAFRIFSELFEKQYGREEARKRIIATTDQARGALKTLADREGYRTFVIPDDVGGRFSVLTAVGLLPIAAAGIDIRELIQGAREGLELAGEADVRKNIPCMYAALRNALYRKGKGIELLASFEPGLHYLGEWWKQLFGESEGKENRGIYPDSLDFSTDLHSMGQYIQQGERMLMETFIDVRRSGGEIVLEESGEDLDGLNYLAGKTLNFVNSVALSGTAAAHNAGGVPTMKFTVPEMNPRYLGQLFYLFEYACGVSGYILGVNPFDQPGVESYKKNMFALLGKPGYEELKARLENSVSGSGEYRI